MNLLNGTLKAYDFRKFLLLLCCAMGGLSAMSQNLSNRGKEFWVSYPYNFYFENGSENCPPTQPGCRNSQEMVLYISAEQDAVVTVTAHVGANTWVRTYNVPAGTVKISDYIPKQGTLDSRLYDLPVSFGGNGGEGHFQKGINIKSTVPIVVYAHYMGSATSGAAMLFPVEAYGYTYTTLNNQQNYSNSYTYFYVMASHDNTVVQITPSVLTRTNKPAGAPFTVTLNKNQSYQVIANSLSGDLSGSTIRSIANASGECYPIAVFCGTSRTGLGCSSAGSSGDFIMQQCFPAQAWGKRYLTAPTSNGSAANSLMTNIYRVLVKDPTTVVKKNGTVLTGMTAAGYYQYNSGTADYIESDKPIMVAQYMSSTGACPNTGGEGDPEMMYISPIEQAIKRTGFFRNNKEAISRNYVTLIIPTAGLASLKIDGSSTFSHTYAHPNLTGYSVVVRRWVVTPANDPSNPPPPGQCVIESDSAFTAITYGLGSVESYGYNAGTLINNLSALGQIHNTYDTDSTVNSYSCPNTPLELSILMAYKPTKMVWKLSRLDTVITPGLDVTVDLPVPLDSPIINGNKYYRYKLPQTYSFSKPGTYEIPVLATHPVIENCNNTEEVRFAVTVKENPFTNFSISHSGCTKDTVRFTGLAPSNGYSAEQWNWTFPGGVTATGQQASHLFTSPGNHDVTLTLISAEGCVGDTTRTIPIAPPPTATFGIDPAAVCEGGNIVFTDTSSFTGSGSISSWYWDFGNGSTVNATNANAQTITYPTYGTFTVRHAVKVSDACVSDTVSKVVKVNARPRLGFNYPAGCLPEDGVVQFTSTTTVPDGQSLTAYAWTFGDPNATPANPNTSTLANPTHIYTSFGSYNITYSATTSEGCTKDTSVAATFNLRPQLAYPSIPPVCENVTGTISVAAASVTNGVTGTGIYRGPGTDAAGNFNPLVAGSGTHTIWYVFTSTGGCKDSISQTVGVYAKPRARFTYPAGGCLPVSGLVQFTNTTTIADGQGLTYLWNFGDANATPANPNTSTQQDPTHNYAEGTYSIKLTVNSSNGCVGDTTITASFSVRPQLAYTALNNLCENAGQVSVATASVTNGATGTGMYKGPGTNAAGSFNPQAAGPGTHTIWYIFTTAGGCKDSISQTLSVYAKPVVRFTYPAGGCLAIDGLVQFTNNTTIADGQALTYLWNFGDPNANAGNPNTSTLQNPTHNYADGNYAIKLTVNSANGCVGDTTINAAFSLRPQLAYPALAAACASVQGTVSVATATVTNGANGTGLYRGPGTDAAGNFSPSTAGAGTHTIWYVFTSNGGCKDSISQTILVRAKPRPMFTISPTGCLPVNGQVQFTNGTTISDGQPMTWAWNFGDPNANAGNPNTSTLQNPVHNYLEGNYSIKLTITTSNGCTADTTISTTLSVRPQLAYAALNNVCESVTGTVSVATATVTNGITGTGIYRGPGVNAAGNFSPSAAGPGTHTIWYVFTTAGGCKDSISNTVLVYPKPVSSFTATTNICRDQSATITDNSTIPSGTITSWQWDFGNGTNATNTNNNPFTISYATHNAYTVKLVTTSNNGCTSDPVTRTINVHPLPVADFSLPTAVCMPGGNASFTNLTSLPGNGALTYQWNFGDGSLASSTSSPTHVYNTSGPFSIRLTARSANGCTDDTVKVLSAFFSKPVAAFSASPDTLCQGTDNVFTDESTAPGSTIRSWSWNFGDNTTSSNPNPGKRYALPGTYNVQLTVTNAAGCVSDPFIDQVLVYLQPVIDAGPSFVVSQGTPIQFNPRANDSSVLRFSWSPAGDFSNPNVLRPTLVAMRDATYTLTAIGPGNCSATDVLTVKIFKPVRVPNAFTPNGDGINDTWILANLSDYPGATVEVFNRYGQVVHRAMASALPWDGKFKGSPLPVATYYYIIDLKNGFAPMQGSVTIIR